MSPTADRYIALCCYLVNCIIYNKQPHHGILSLFFQQSVEHLQRLFEKFVPKVLDFRRHHCKELIPTSELNSVASLCVLFDALATEENGVRLKMSCSNLESCLNYV